MEKYSVIGMMSGTSLDGLDIAHCRFQYDGNWSFEIVDTQHIPYDTQWKKRLNEAPGLSGEELAFLDIRYGEWLGNQVKRFIEKHDLKPDFIASHGHTIFHQPEKGLTLQIGNGAALAEVSGFKVICDFRSKDVALGGQGAPLVPVGDRLLFSTYCACLNLGGISNISFERKRQRLAYDIGVANMLLNDLAGQLGKDYDKGGVEARKGKCIESLLHDLNALEYYQLPFPKSTGLEWYLSEVKPVINQYQETVQDLLHTAVVHIADRIATDVKEQKLEGKLLVTGGGARNTFLIEQIKRNMPKEVEIEIPENTLLDYKEAMAFAFLGVLRSLGQPNCLSSVTGASFDSCGGVIYE